MLPYVPPSKRNLVIVPKQKVLPITNKTCMKCGCNSLELNEFLLCSKCIAYCFICGKKPAEFGKTNASRCIDCRYLGDQCFTRKLPILKTHKQLH